MLEFIKARKKAFIMGYIDIGIVYSIMNLPNLIRSAGEKKYLNLTAPLLGVARMLLWPIFVTILLVKKFILKKKEG